MTATDAEGPRPARNRFGCFTALGFVTAGFLALIAILAVIIFGATAAPVSAANAFFKTAARDGASAAYATTAPLFRTTTSQSAFEAVASAANLSMVEKATWNARGTLNGVARLSGHLHYQGGGSQAVAVQLSKVEGRWRVLWLDVGPNAVANLAATDPGRSMSGLNGSTPLGGASSPPTNDSPAGLSGPGVPPASSDASPGLGGAAPAASAAPSGGPTINLYDARTILADGTPAVRGSAVGQFCKTLFREARGLNYDRVDCPMSLAMTAGAQTRCVATMGLHSIGMSVDYRGQGADQKPQLHCQVDSTPLS